MPKRKNYLSLIAIFILAFLAGNFAFPQFLNIPYFPNIPFKLGLDLQGGAHLVYQADLTGINPGERAKAMEGLRDVIERRVDIFGVVEPRVEVKDERLVVELAGVLDVAEAIRIIGETPFLQFKEQRAPEETEKILAKQEKVREKIGQDVLEITPEDFQKIQEIENWEIAFWNPYFKPTALTGKYLQRSEVTFGYPVREPVISLQFNEEGAKIFEEITARNIGRQLGIYLDGMSIIDTDGDGKITPNDIYAPVVREKITGGRAQISGDLTIERAKEVSRNLNAGALPVPIELISQQTVGPILGRISLDKSLIAGLFGFLAVIIYLILFYRLPGLLAALTLGIYILLLLALFKVVGVTLTLAGIAGVILSIGMAVDANILIFSRMKEELKENKSVDVSIEEGFKRAWPSIRDGNLTTIIVALILFLFGTGFVKGFALTLIIGILISMFSAVIISKNFLIFCERTKLAEVKWLWGQ
jgi:protein-export membrane protein SecD